MEGLRRVAMATGIAPSTIGRGLKELAWEEPSERVRRPGVGRKTTVSKDPTLLRDLEALVEPATRGDPGSPLRWTCSTMRATACKATARPRRVIATPTGMRSLATSGSGGTAAGDLARHQEKRIGRGFPQPRPRVSPARQSGRG